SLHHRQLTPFPTRRSSDLYYTWHRLSCLLLEPRSNRVPRAKPSGAQPPSESQEKRAFPAPEMLPSGRPGSTKFSTAWTRCILMRSEEHTSELQSLAYLVCR